MGVKVRFIGGTRPVAGQSTTFSDDFTRANTTNGLGNFNYLKSASEVAGLALIDSRCNIATNRLQMRRNPLATAGAMYRSIWIPRATMLTLYGRSQFAEMGFVSTTGGTVVARVGPICSFQGSMESEFHCYQLIAANATAWNLRRVSQTTTGTETITTLANAVLADGDLMRLNVTMEASQNLWEVLINGVSVASGTDTDASRPIQAGFPCMSFWQSDPSVTTLWSNFRVGLL